MDFEKEYSIKEYAKLKGISTQAVYKQLSKSLKPYVIERDGKKYISGQAFNQVEQPVGNHSTAFNQPVESEIIQLLRAQLEEKDKQISTLFNQVEQITNQLKTTEETATRLITLLENTQKIEAGRLLVEAKSEKENNEQKDDNEVIEVKKKTGIFSRIFHK